MKKLTDACSTPQTKASAVLWSPLIFLWILAFFFQAANVGKDDTFSLQLTSPPQQNLPTFSVVQDAGEPSLPTIKCRHCHYRIPTEFCSQQPLLPAKTITQVGNVTTEYQFNSDGSVQADQATDSVIVCSLTIPSLINSGVISVYIYDGPARYTNENDLRPGGEIHQVFTPGTINLISFKKMVTKFSNSSIITDYLTVNSDTYPNPISPNIIEFRLFYGTFIISSYVENFTPSYTFWTFMGVVGGCGFLMYMLHEGVMFFLNLFLFKNEKRGNYEQL